MYVVVVESHQHVLEHIHGELRKFFRKRKICGKFHMIHFDAHPDLACPGKHIPAAACYEPRRNWKYTGEEASCNNNTNEEVKNLYELLDSTSGGIAEWILPLCLGADLREIYWIRSPWSDQIDDGWHNFHVGASINLSLETLADEKRRIVSFADLPEKATVKVDFPHRYYFDDQSVESFSDLILPEKVDLSVSLIDDVFKQKSNQNTNCCSGHNNTKENHLCNDFIFPKSDNASLKRKRRLENEQKQDSTSKKDPWMLDICLDYFACLNPFIVELESISEEFTKALLNISSKTRLHVSSKEYKGTSVDNRIDESQKEHAEFFRLMKLLLDSFLYGKFGTLKSSDYQLLIRMFPSSSEGITLIENLKLAYKNASCTSTVETNKLIDLSKRAIQNITMPHDQNSINESLVMERIKKMGSSLRRWRNGIESSNEDGIDETVPSWIYNNDPFVITVARSTLDGFIPQAIVENVQKAVLKELHSIFCGCELQNFDQPSSTNSDCKFNLVFDYGMWEGSSCDDLI